MNKCAFPNCSEEGTVDYECECYACKKYISCKICINCDGYYMTHFCKQSPLIRWKNYGIFSDIIRIDSYSYICYGVSFTSLRLVISDNIVLGIAFFESDYPRKYGKYKYQKIVDSYYVGKEITDEEFYTYTFENMSTTPGSYISSLPRDIRNIIGYYCTTN